MWRALIMFSDMWWSNMVKDGVQWCYVNDSDTCSRWWVLMVLIDIWAYVLSQKFREQKVYALYKECNIDWLKMNQNTFTDTGNLQ